MKKTTKKVDIVPPDVAAKALAEEQIAEQAKKIDFYTTEYTLEILANKVRDGEFVVPGYQREFTWEDDRKHRFVESLLMGLPIPFLFFWERPDGKLEIVDGSQRLRTIHEFIYGELRLGQLERLPLLKDHAFADLLESRRRKLLNRPVRGIVLNEHADAVARLDMFDRINTGSKNANFAEIRRGVAAGPFLDLVIELANDDQFVALTPVTEKQRLEREREELVARFFAYGDGLVDYHDRPAEFVLAYSRKMNKEFASNPALVETYREEFNAVLEFVKTSFRNGFAKNAKSKTSPRARFEAIAIGVRLALKQNSALSVPQNDIDSWASGQEFADITGSDGANVRSKLSGRIEFVRAKLLA